MVEDVLVHSLEGNNYTEKPVLILVVVEDVLVRATVQLNAQDFTSLNPCCGGRCSSTPTFDPTSLMGGVLILVVVEDVLVRWVIWFMDNYKYMS